MGGGGKKGGKPPKVPYYYMTIHYGICHGVLDSINQIWVKEKQIFCGSMTGPGNMYINQPELFGGQTKEGGVDGVVECYFGTEDQEMSNTVKTRFPSHATRLPAYRGIANLFFRGYDSSELEFRPGGGPAEGSGGGSIFYKLFSALGDTGLFDGGREGDFKPEGGFGWVVNNPYLPPAWANVTRIGKPFGPTYAKIGQPLNGKTGNRTGPFVGYNYTYQSTFIDLTDIGDAVDAGLVTVTLTSTTYCEDSVTHEPAGCFHGLYGIPRTAGGGLVIPNHVDGEDTFNETSSAAGGGTLVMVRTIPPGTRQLEVYARILATYPIFSRFGFTSNVYNLSFTQRGPTLCEDPASAGAPPDMNPAYIIAECLTNRQWGMGAPIEGLNVDSFMDAAETFYNEHFGLSMMWREQTTIEKFIMEVLDHVQAMLYINPRTGLWEIKPLRGDYDIDGLRVLDETNCTTRNRQRKGEGEIINEIIISYTDFKTEEDKTVTFHDLAAIAQVGQIVSETRNYYGIRYPYTANMVGQRDIRTASYPLFSAEVEADRSFRDVKPGEVLKLTIPEDGIVEMAVRVAKVNYGAPGDAKIRFNVTEDIFGLESSEYGSVQESLWEPVDAPPIPLTNQRIIEAPLPLMLRAGVGSVSDDDYPAVVTAIMGDTPSQPPDTISIWGDKTKPSGGVETKVIGSITTTPSGYLIADLPEEATSTMTEAFVRELARPQTVDEGMFLYLDAPNETGEFLMLKTLDPVTKIWTVTRAVFDTIPRFWPSGSLIWFAGDADVDVDPNSNSVGVTKTYKLLPKTSGGTLNPADATPINFTPSERPYMPFRPANAQLAANGYAEKKYSSNDVGGIPATVTATWATRNRLQEDGLVPNWTDAPVTPEVGQTTLLRVRERASQAVVFEYTGLTGNSFAIPTVDLIDFRFYDVQFLSERDGFESLQFAVRGLDLERLGYGNNYGFDYGQNDGS